MIIINDTKLKWTDLIPGDVIKKKDGSKVAIVTAIDYKDWRGFHVCTYEWLNDLELEKWEKVEK